MRAYLLVVVLMLAVFGHCASGLEGDLSLFPATMQLGETQLTRMGAGRMRRWMITGADVALYAPAGTSRENILDDMPRALSFYYYVTIRGEQFARAAIETLQQNVDADALARHAGNIELMGSWFTTVRRGDRYLLSYIPGKGTSLALNGVHKGTIPDPEFAHIYFQIWLGKNPIDERMYAAMTGGMPQIGMRGER
jgi:hypothetical protein